MALTLEEAKLEVEQLPEAERAELASYLLASLDAEEEGLDASWEAELARRVEEIRTGRAVGRPADEIFAELRASYP